VPDVALSASLIVDDQPTRDQSFDEFGIV